MLPVILKRSTFAAHKVWQWAGSPQRCWTSVLTGASRGESSFLQICWASTTRFPFTERDDVRGKPPTVLGFRKKLFQKAQAHAAPFFVRNQYFHSTPVKLKKRPLPEPTPRELDLLRYDMKELWKGPKPALFLGFAGLIPFVAPTLFMLVSEIFCPELAYAQLAYGASIISFVGGARWGFALPESSPAKPDWINLTNSVVPSLFACTAILMSSSIVPSLTLVIMGLGVSLHYDLSLLPTYPPWFKALRATLTIVAFFSLLGTIFINSTYPEKKIFFD
ncbi:transmembrane protein 69-like [Brachionichthys hirsutus]|uniref:transmembrane protein 69-like n=1 Tax=Brachionichthys hirsutus TaxID=412623 RepID=UPI0036048A40